MYRLLNRGNGRTLVAFFEPQPWSFPNHDHQVIHLSLYPSTVSPLQCAVPFVVTFLSCLLCHLLPSGAFSLALSCQRLYRLPCQLSFFHLFSLLPLYSPCYSPMVLYHFHPSFTLYSLIPSHFSLFYQTSFSFYTLSISCPLSFSTWLIRFVYLFTLVLVKCCVYIFLFLPPSSSCL